MIYFGLTWFYIQVGAQSVADRQVCAFSTLKISWMYDMFVDLVFV